MVVLLQSNPNQLELVMEVVMEVAMEPVQEQDMEPVQEQVKEFKDPVHPINQVKQDHHLSPVQDMGDHQDLVEMELVAHINQITQATITM